MASDELARAHAASAAATRRLLDGIRAASHGSTVVSVVREVRTSPHHCEVDVLETPTKPKRVAAPVDGLPGDMPVVVRAISTARSSGGSVASDMGDKNGSRPM